MKVRIQNILDFPCENQMEIRDWRNAPEIANNLIQPYVEEDTHKNWLESLKKDNPSSIVFFIIVNNERVGITYLHGIDKNNNIAEWGQFLSPLGLKKYGGIGVMSAYLLLNYAFNEMLIRKINIEVLDSNRKVLSFDKKLGFKPEGIRRGNIIKDNKNIDLHLLGMFDYEWHENKSKIEKVINTIYNV